MRRLIRRWLADRVLDHRERFQLEAQSYAQPWVRQWLRREFWEPARRELLGEYPAGHPYYQDNLVIRFYPLVMTVLFVGGIVAIVAVSILRWLTR